jgi:hypothetical protein
VTGRPPHADAWTDSVKRDLWRVAIRTTRWSNFVGVTRPGRPYAPPVPQPASVRVPVPRMVRPDAMTS